MAVLAALVAFVACKRRRSAAGCLPGRALAKPDLSGLPTTLRPSVYKQVISHFERTGIPHENPHRNNFLELAVL